jgi:hypothetical protein
MRRKRTFLVLMFVLFMVLGGLAGFVAQDQVNFSVVSIKPSPDNFPGMVIRQLGNGGYSAQKVVLVALLTSAYGVSPQRILGLPSWGTRIDTTSRPAMNLETIRRRH